MVFDQPPQDPAGSFGKVWIAVSTPSVHHRPRIPATAIQRLVQPRQFVNRLDPKAALALVKEEGGLIIGGIRRGFHGDR